MRKVNNIEKRVNFSLNGKNDNAYLPFGISICIESGENKEKLFKNLEINNFLGEKHLLQQSSSINRKNTKMKCHLFRDGNSLTDIVNDILSPQIQLLGSPIHFPGLDTSNLFPQRPFLILIDMEKSNNFKEDFEWDRFNVIAAQARALGISILICYPALENIAPFIFNNHIGEINLKPQKKIPTGINFFKNLIFSKNRVDFKESPSKKAKTIRL